MTLIDQNRIETRLNVINFHQNKKKTCVNSRIESKQTQSRRFRNGSRNKRATDTQKENNNNNNNNNNIKKNNNNNNKLEMKASGSQVSSERGG